MCTFLESRRIIIVVSVNNFFGITVELHLVVLY